MADLSALETVYEDIISDMEGRYQMNSLLLICLNEASNMYFRFHMNLLFLVPILIS